MSNFIIRLLILSLLFCGCDPKTNENKATYAKVDFNPKLAQELKRMAEVDQIAAYIPEGKYKKMTKEQWQTFKDSVFMTHHKRIEEIFDKYGFVGIDLAGKEGSQNFWLIVQHSDHEPEFQREVLKQMKIEVENKNADPSNYGMLVDRVNINTGKKQIFGTQIAYNMETGQAFAKNLEDSLNVNERRKSIGLEPLENYLNSMTQMHFEMNKAYYTKIGVTSPSLYKIQQNTE